mgnify:CR=1 FL=1
MSDKVLEKIIFSVSVALVCLLFLAIGLSNAPTKTEYIEIPKTVTVTEIKEVPPKADFEYLGEFTVTAYCPYEDEYGNATARPYNGEYIAVEGITVAVDPEVIPYGSVVIIDGHSYIAHDCGGAVKGKVIDIYFDSVEAMNAWGKQTKEVYVKRTK